MGERRGAYRVLLGKSEKGRPLGDPGIDRRIILKLILQKFDGGHGLDQSGSGEGQVVGCCECSNEPFGSINSGEFLE
jgi:hypothetical protein